MAPAACDTIEEHLKNMGRKSSDYDFIATGDLGKLGSEILIDLMENDGIILGKNYQDCGCMMYDKTQRVFMGGSGAGCSASIFNSYILSKLKKGEFKRVLLVSTGALMSTTTSQQGDTIPSIAHAVEFEYVPTKKQISSNVNFGHKERNIVNRLRSTGKDKQKTANKNLKTTKHKLNSTEVKNGN